MGCAGAYSRWENFECVEGREYKGARREEEEMKIKCKIHHNYMGNPSCVSYRACLRKDEAFRYFAHLIKYYPQIMQGDFWVKDEQDAESRGLTLFNFGGFGVGKRVTDPERIERLNEIARAGRR